MSWRYIEGSVEWNEAIAMNEAFDNDVRQLEKDIEIMRRWLQGEEGCASNDEINEICDKYVVKDPRIGTE